MVALVPEILGLGIGMIASPGIVALIIFLLSKGKKGISHAWIFLLGNVLTLIILLTAGLAIGTAIHSNDHSSFQNGVDFFIGLLFLFFGIKTFRTKNQKIKKKNKGHFFWFFVGFLASITNADAETLFLVSMHEIVQCSPEIIEAILLVAYCCFMILLPVLLPLGIYYAAPQKSKKILSKLDKPVKKYGRKFAIFILFFFATIFLFKGLGLI